MTDKVRIKRALISVSDKTGLEELGRQLDLEIRESTNITFASYSVPGMGIEPKVIAQAVNLPKDQLSKAIKGKSAVYIIRVKAITEPAEDLEFEPQRDRLSRTLASRVDYYAYEALKKVSDIKDKRSKFY